MDQNKNRFMSWRDLIIIPLVQSVIFIISILLTWELDSLYDLDLFTDVVIFYFTMIMCTFLFLKVIRHLFPLKRGVYSYVSNQWKCFIWNLYGYLCITNLSLLYNNVLISPVVRKYFYMLLGAKMGKGVISIGGKIEDPFLVTIEENVMIGEDTLITPHAAISLNILILGEVTIKKGVVIGVKSVIMPSVTIGENSMVQPLSIVTMGTTIPPNEVWGGNPAKKIKDISPPIHDEDWENNLPKKPIQDIPSHLNEGVTHGKM